MYIKTIQEPSTGPILASVLLKFFRLTFVKLHDCLLRELDVPLDPPPLLVLLRPLPPLSLKIVL